MANVDDDVQKMLNDAYDPATGQFNTKNVGTDSGTRGKGRSMEEIFRAVFDTDGTLRVVT